MEADALTWAGSPRVLSMLLAGETPPAPAGEDYTAQIIVALIGALALVLVALIPALINRQKKDAVTAPAPSPPPAPTAEEMARVWTAIGEVRRDQQRSYQQHAGNDALLDECRRDSQTTDAELARVRDLIVGHVARPGHDGAR